MRIEAQLCLILLLSASVVTDLRENRIKNSLILAGYGMAVISRGLGLVSTGWLSGMIGMCIPLIALFFLFLLHALGAGDIKLFSVIGAFVGAEKVVFYMLAGMAAGAIIGICILIRQRDFHRRVTYLLQFIRTIFIQHAIVPYYQNVDYKSCNIHFSVPILIGSCMCMIIQ